MNTKQNRRWGRFAPPGSPGLLKMSGTTGLIKPSAAQTSNKGNKKLSIRYNHVNVTKMIVEIIFLICKYSGKFNTNC